jgi:hypothetical protein
MPQGFVAALFNRMEREGWPISSSFDGDRVVARDLDLRPEVFWRIVLENGGAASAIHSLEAVNLSVPNKNHFRIASLLKSGRCGIAITTNFDEYVERYLTEEIRVIVPISSDRLDPPVGPIYLKLHGTVGKASSLSYTLEQYDQFGKRAQALAALLDGSPLLIAGYSGFDTDVMPAFEIAAPRAPFVVTMRHPGSPATQPILGLGAGLDTVYILEAPASDVLEVLCDGLPESLECNTTSAPVRRPTSVYEEAVEEMPPPHCPFLLTQLFAATGHWGQVRKYAWLSHDACCDVRYRERLGESKFRDIHRTIAYALKLAGDDSGARIMVGEARGSLDEFGGPISEGMSNLITQMRIKNAPNFRTAGAPPKQPSASADKFTAAGMLAAAANFPFGSDANPRNRFLSGWQIGVERRREGDSSGAVDMFESAMQVLLSEEQIASHLERARFLLDYGSAVYERGMTNENSEDMASANQLYLICEEFSRRIADWPTCAKAQLMVARCAVLRGSIEDAREHALASMESAKRSGDWALGQRVDGFLKELSSFENRSS